MNNKKTRSNYIDFSFNESRTDRFTSLLIFCEIQKYSWYPPERPAVLHTVSREAVYSSIDILYAALSFVDNFSAYAADTESKRGFAATQNFTWWNVAVPFSLGLNGDAVWVGSAAGAGAIVALSCSFFAPQLDRITKAEAAIKVNLFTGGPFDWCIFIAKLHCKNKECQLD